MIGLGGGKKEFSTKRMGISEWGRWAPQLRSVNAGAGLGAPRPGRGGGGKPSSFKRWLGRECMMAAGMCDTVLLMAARCRSWQRPRQPPCFTV